MLCLTVSLTVFWCRKCIIIALLLLLLYVSTDLWFIKKIFFSTMDCKWQIVKKIELYQLLLGLRTNLAKNILLFLRQVKNTE